MRRLKTTSVYLKAPGTRNLPPDGKVLFILGQDSSTLGDYHAVVLATDPSFPHPGGVMLYTNLTGAPMSGMYNTVDFGSCQVNFRTTLSEYGGALVVGLSLFQCDQLPLLAMM